MLLDLKKRPKKSLPPDSCQWPLTPVPPPVRHPMGCGRSRVPPPSPPPMRVERVPSPPSRFWCFFGVHKYEIKDESTWKRTGHNDEVLAKGPMYILRCPVCGKMKADRLAYNG